MVTNERIKELAQEVFSFKYKSNPNELNPDHNMDHIHKFAELIVQECIDYCGENLSKTVGGALKIHFGVEE